MPPELKKAVAERMLDPVDEQETIDLLGHRYFRASILAGADAPRTTTSHAALLEQVHIAASLRSQSESLDLDEGAVQQFVGAGRSEVTLDSSIGKAAVVLLSAEWPYGVRLDRLYEESLALLVKHDRPVPPDARRQLLDAIESLFEAGQVDLRLREPKYDGEITKYPRAHALARWEAERRDSLTTPHHLPVAFEGAALELVRSLDGSRSRSDLQRMFDPELVERTLHIMARCGLLEESRRMRRAAR